MISPGLSDSVAGVSETPAKCRHCGATTRLGNGLCLSCTLREGLEDDCEASSESFQAILAEDEVRDTQWRIGNYEILEEIGRGGMGVIYRARQRHSRRIVALKRIVSYHADSHETLERFRREAEAAASLDHPNILPIYEVGQGEDGLPFFSMKYAAGGSLQKAEPALHGEPRECVRLMAKVARAVQYAHEHGVLHRDLKPGNILLDGRGEPFVTDFGLAKWLDTTTDLTRTLAIFGTPGYIAPEQAKGPAAKLTPVADVYSLGAILFDLFTGRPPFLGEHALAVIQQATEKPAPKLRSVAPTLDRDLETICARCLEREPQARYRSAGDLAIDFERWLEGRPIIARRVSPPVRAWRWAKRNPKLAAATAAAFCSATAAAFLFFSHNGLAPQSDLDSTLAPEKSIAVLPFENLSPNPDNAYFAEGIQDEILTRLSKIADLKVISRTSTQHYKSAPANLPDIARQLGVAHILEGSVQKSGDTVRVNVQMIKAASDSHVWAETYDRRLSDIFSVESEVAKAITDQLQATLTGREEQVIAAKPTDNPEAYDAYLRGLAYSLKTANTSTNALGAQKYLKEAVRLDPKFALAWALLSYVEARGYITQFLQPTVALRDDAQQAAERAVTLQPNLGEAILAKGFYQYACLKDYDTAVRYFEQARPLLPNSSRIPELLAYVTRRQGQWERSESYFNEAERLDPRNVSLLTQHALSYKDRRLFPEAWRKFEQILNITPDDLDTIVEKAVIAQAEGDLPRASALLVSLQPAADDTNALETQAYQEILERRPAQITARLKDILVKPDAALGFYKGELRFWLGWTQEVVGDHVAAKESWRQARSELESFLKEQPENHILLGDLALTDMSLGDKAAALSLSEHGMSVNPIEKDAVTGPASIEFFARVAAQAGEADRAITALQKLLSTSYSGPLGPGAPLTPALLRLDPMFDPLRNDPRFQELISPTGIPKDFGTPAQIPEKSIAVLPFENLSEEKANAYFAEGVQDEILTRLAGVRDLKVISRTSTAKYQSKPDNLKRIAQELGVSTILEGTVQKAGDKVRVNVQLIDARADTHLWAKSYDRDLKDVLKVESEVSREIAEALQANLSPSESHVLTAARTQDAEAYDLFLRGEYEFYQAEISPTAEAYDRADAFYRQALARDPNFAEAAAGFAYCRLSRHWNVSPLAPAKLEEVKSLIDRALALAPNSPEAHLALGLFFYWAHRQYEMALAEFNRTLELQPNNALARQYCAWVYRRRGEWERSLADSQRAQELDPRDAGIPSNIGETYLALRLWKDAERAELRALAINPHHAAAALALLYSRLNSTGDVDSARRALDGFPEAIKAVNLIRRGGSVFGDVGAIIGNWVYLDVIKRRFTDAFQEFEKGVVNDYRAHLQQLAGRAALRVLAGQTEAAKSAGEEALPLLEARFRERPDDIFAVTELSWVYLALGRNDDALRLSRQAVDTIPIEKDAVTGPYFQNGLAQIEARAGAPVEAIKRLRRLLSIPAGWDVSIARLKIDPVWDPIRNRPDFQQLLSGPEQIGPNK